MWKNTRNVIYKTSAVRNSRSKGNIDGSKCAPATTDKPPKKESRGLYITLPTLIKLIVRTKVELS